MQADIDSVRALSINQPWASLILGGHKLTENRVWTTTTYRGLLIVHAGLNVARHAAELGASYGVTEAPIGAYLGVVQLQDIHQAHPGCGCNPVFAQPDVFHWRLSAPQPFAQPIPGRGRQRLFRPPAEVAELALTTSRQAA
jgi:hypothetical protein